MSSRAGSAAPCSSSSRAQRLLVCGHCGGETPLPDSDEEIEELDFHEWLASVEEDEEETEAVLTVSCPSCGAELERDARAVL